nr:MAG TPA: hypothetical protein [Caudoviricetes sp.]
MSIDNIKLLCIICILEKVQRLECKLVGCK